MQRAIKKKKKVDKSKMGILTRRRTSWTTITYEVPVKETEEIYSDFVRKNSTDMGVDILIEKEVENSVRYECLVRVEPMEGDSSLYSVRFATNHEAFSLKKICNIRSFSSFYFLERTLVSNQIQHYQSFHQNLCFCKHSSP